MQSLRRTRPESLQDITIQVAIVRPGPIQGGAVNPYIERRQRLRVEPDYKVPYEHPSLEPVLRETLGTIIFQDQVLEVAIAFAGFSAGEAEGLRRAMSRKRSEAAIEAYHRRFVAGARRRHGVDEATAERVFSMVQGFSGFGFPKAHGAAFGLLAYQSTWLRVHYSPEFLCSLLNEQPMGFYPPDALIHEAQRRGIEVLAPDVNESGAECEMQIDPDGSGTSVVSESAWATSGASASRRSRTLVDAREAVGRFRSLSDLASRAGAGAPSLELLAWSGACDSLVAEPASSSSARDSRTRARPRPRPRARRGVVRHDGSPCGSSASQPRGETSRAEPSWRSRSTCRRRRRLQRLSAWESMLADYVDDGTDRALASDGAAARPPAGRLGHEPGSRDARARHADSDSWAGRRSPASGYRQRNRLRPARGRIRDDQPDRPRAGL